MGVLEIERDTMNEKYLGLPVYVGQSKTRIFSYLKDRVWNRIQGWKEKMLSWAGKEFFIKAIAQAIRTFAMGCFDLTKALCDQISTMICRYRWNQQEGKHKIHWLSWDKTILPKEDGGLGFRDIHAFNKAMLAKPGWKLLTNPDSLCALILQAKYFPSMSSLRLEQGCSYPWPSILQGIELVKKGMIWRVGDGENLKIWLDPWLPRELPRRPVTPRGATILTQVAELIDPGTGNWEAELVKEIFWEEDARIILALPVHGARENVLAWHYDKHGRFSVRSAYKVYHDDIQLSRGQSSSLSVGENTGATAGLCGRLWNMRCPNKLKHFLWRLSHNSHALRMNLRRRRMKVDTRCVVCQRFDEDEAHLFFKCKEVKRLWRELNLNEERAALATMQSPLEVLSYIVRQPEMMQRRISIFLWNWWKERNRIREGEGKRPVQSTCKCTQNSVICSRN